MCGVGHRWITSSASSRPTPIVSSANSRPLRGCCGGDGQRASATKALAAADLSSSDRSVQARLDWLVSLTAQLAALDAEAKQLEARMAELLDEHGSTLTEIFGMRRGTPRRRS